MHPTLRQVPPSLPFSIMAMLRPGRRAVERGGVAAGSAADDDDVVVLGRGDHLRGCRGRGAGRTGRDRLPASGREPGRPSGRRSRGRCCCWAWRCWTTWAWRRISTMASVLGPAAARVDAADGRHVVVVAAVADRDVALADLLGVGRVEGQPAPAGDGRLEPGVGLHRRPRRRRRRHRSRRRRRRSSRTRSGPGCRCCGTAPRRGGRSPGRRPWPWPAPRSRRRRCRWRPACTAARCARSGAGPARCRPRRRR